MSALSEWIADTRPEGVELLEHAGVTFIHNAHRNQSAFGWYYGYTACCVQAFLDGCCSSSHHPVSGHVLCAFCERLLAPLPPRPAELLGMAYFAPDDGELWVDYPHKYTQVPRSDRVREIGEKLAAQEAERVASLAGRWPF